MPSHPQEMNDHDMDNKGQKISLEAVDEDTLSNMYDVTLNITDNTDADDADDSFDVEE